MKPQDLRLVATVEAIVDEDVERFVLKMQSEAVATSAARGDALETMLKGLYPFVPREIRGDPVAIRQAAGRRPRARVRVLLEAREGGLPAGEARRIGGPADDVREGEGDALQDRAMQLLAARTLDELAAL